MKELLDQALFYLDALWRRRWQVVGISFMLVAMAWSAVAYLPNQYTSSARIYVDTENVLRPLLRGLTVDSDLQHQVQVMRLTLLSRPNLEEVARMTDLDIEAETPSAYEQLIDRLESNINVNSDRQNIFSISYTHRDAQTARNVVQALTTLFVENNLGESREDIDNAQGFLTRQVQLYEEKLNEAERRLARFRQDNLLFLPGQSGLQEALQERRSQLEDLRAQLKDARDKRALLQEELAQTPEMVGAQAGVGGGPPSNLQIRIMETRGQLEELTARYTEQHPDVVTLKRRLERLQQQLENQLAGPAQIGGEQASGSIPNPVYSSMRMELLNTRAEIQSLEDQVRRAEQNVAELEGRINLVPEVEAELKRLSRDYEIIRSQYESLRSRQESAELTADRDRQGNEFAFRMIESPQLPNLPSGPNRALLLIAGFFLSLGAGIGIAWLLAMVKITYGSVDHLRNDFDLPVIGAISELGRPEHGDGKIPKDAIKVAVMAMILIASLGALLYVESRFGILEARMPVYAYLACLFTAGAVIFLLHHRRIRRRYELKHNPDTGDFVGGAVQAP